MRTIFSRIIGIAAVATGLAFAGVASATPIDTTFNFVPTTALTANTGNILTATTISAGAPDVVTSIDHDNTGLITLSTIIGLTDPTPITLGATFQKTWKTALGTFLETLTVTSVSYGVSSVGILAVGTLSQTVGTGLDTVAAFYSASYTQNAQGQINGSFNNSTTPPSKVPEPATLALLGLGLAGLGFTRRRKQ